MTFHNRVEEQQKTQMIDTNVEQSYKREEDKEEEVKQKKEIPHNLLQRLKRVRELWQKRSEPVICEGP